MGGLDRHRNLRSQSTAPDLHTPLYPTKSEPIAFEDIKKVPRDISRSRGLIN
jgi:hypothetical protein